MISVSIHPSHAQSPSVSWGLGESDIPELLMGDILALCAQLFFLEVSANCVGALRCFAERPKAFVRWARKEGLDDDDLLQAADEIASRRFEGNLGGDVVKKRVARAAGAKRGGFRTIVAYRSASSS